MERKQLYEVGNLFTGYPYGVEAERAFGTTELHGPFASENEANTYAHQLIEDRNRVEGQSPYESVKVVVIETPQVGRMIVRNREDHSYQYSTEGFDAFRKEGGEFGQ